MKDDDPVKTDDPEKTSSVWVVVLISAVFLLIATVILGLFLRNKIMNREQKIEDNINQQEGEKNHTAL